MKRMPITATCISIKNTCGEILRIATASIYYLWYYGDKKVEIFTKDDKIVANGTLEDYRKMLDNNFVYTSRSFIVNLAEIKAINGYDLMLTDDSSIPIAVRRLTTLKKALNTYIQNQILPF